MGPLQGIRIVEFAGIGPVPFCAMLLADMGAEVVRIDRKGSAATANLGFFDPRLDVLNRGRRSVSIDLKRSGGVDAALRLVKQADALIEGFRPGVMERLGLGPDVCLAMNPRLVYGRMTGWGQHGPLAQAAGHDINYIALSGALHLIGRAGERPVAPPALIGDFGGGGMFLAFGIVCALLEARTSGQGQVVDTAITDGSALLTALIHGLKAMLVWNDARGTNVLDSGAHFYDAYECADGKWVTIGALEPQFYALLLEKCGIHDLEFSAQMDKRRWPALKEKMETLFRSRTRDEWCALLEGTDACFAPVLDLDEAPQHPHHQARQAFVEVGGVPQPAPAPRFSRTPPDTPTPPSLPGEHTGEVLAEWGFSAEEIAQLKAGGII
jgi:alpha-methylacyl-CoA racemase